MVNVNCGACGHLNSRGYCSLTACIFPCSFGTGGYINKPTTNGDHIRSASDEELARFLDFNFMTLGRYMDYEKWLSWLREDVEDVPIEYYENGGK